MRSYVAYQLINGTPRRVLSLSTRRPGGHGTAHPGDAPGPKEFFQAAAFLSEGERPTTFPMTEKVMIHFFMKNESLGIFLEKKGCRQFETFFKRFVK